MEKAGSMSYRANEPEQVVNYLILNGYRFAQPRSPSEHARCTKGASLLVLYNNGTVLLQGADTESPRPLLESFQPSQQIELPF